MGACMRGGRWDEAVAVFESMLEVRELSVGTTEECVATKSSCLFADEARLSVSTPTSQEAQRAMYFDFILRVLLCQ
eukprot:723100-Prorocentrum_minimum.AAC.1